MKPPVVLRSLPPQAPARLGVPLGSAFFVAQALNHLGASFGDVATQAGFSPAVILNPEPPISIEWLGRLLSSCSEATGYRHFGLWMGSCAATHITAQAASAAQAAPTIGVLLAAMLSLLPDFSSLLLTLKATADTCTIGCAHIDSGVQGREHIADAILALANGVLRAVCGPHWHPMYVSFERFRPIDALPYLVEFKAQLEFGGEQTALTFARGWLANPPSRSEIARRVRLAQAASDRAPVTPLGQRALPDTVRHILRGREKQLTEKEAAVTFGLHPSTFHRRLARSHTSFSRLLDEAQYEKARRFLLETEEPIDNVAKLLGYSSASAFVRAFRFWSGLAPAKWRACEERRMEKAETLRGRKGTRYDRTL